MDEFATREEIEDFLNHIGLLKSTAPQHNYGGYGQSHYADPYANDSRGQSQPGGPGNVYTLNSVLDGFRKLFNKSPDALYQETLSMIYLESKRQDLSQTVFTIFTEIDEIDGTKDGYVNTQQFIDAVTSVLGIRSQKPIDFEYLSLKYRHMDADTREERQQVWYKAFYNDYDYLDCNGLSGSIHGLNMLVNEEMESTKASSTGGENPFKFEIPQKFLTFYMKIEGWIRKRKSTERFCEIVIREDRTREGFLTNRQLE